MAAKSAVDRSSGPGVLHTVEGSWRSELGSQLELHNTEGFLTGRDISAVGSDRCPQALFGQCTQPMSTGTVILGFVVCWTGSSSLTTWTGRYDGATDRLNLHWVLETATHPPTAWRSTQLGQDTFYRDEWSVAQEVARWERTEQAGCLPPQPGLTPG